RVPENVASTSVAKLAKAANVAICRLPSTSSHSANTPGRTMVARTARSAAGRDHLGSQFSRCAIVIHDALGREIVEARAALGTASESTREPRASPAQTVRAARE